VARVDLIWHWVGDVEGGHWRPVSRGRSARHLNRMLTRLLQRGEFAQLGFSDLPAPDGPPAEALRAAAVHALRAAGRDREAVHFLATARLKDALSIALEACERPDADARTRACALRLQRIDALTEGWM
jgi:hypothetical protein